MVAVPGGHPHRRVANGAGIGGATFFSPLFVIVLGLEPAIAVGAALVTEVFGFGSGVLAHQRAGAIDWRLVRLLASVSVPAAIAGSIIAGVAPETLLKIVLAVGLFGIAITFLRHHDPEKEDAEISVGVGVVDPSTQRRIVTADHQIGGETSTSSIRSRSRAMSRSRSNTE